MGVEHSKETLILKVYSGVPYTKLSLILSPLLLLEIANGSSPYLGAIVVGTTKRL